MSSNSLEKLKALTSKLEKKLAEKKGLSLESEQKQEPVETAVPEQAEAVPEVTSQVEAKEEKVPEEAQSETPVSVSPPVPEEVVEKTVPISGDQIREENIERVHLLYDDLKISEKCPDFNKIFSYKAMNLSGIGLKEEDFGEVRTGKYIQVIAITYEPDKKTGKKKAKNVSLGYFGKGDTIDPDLKNRIIEFVLRWRYEKAFQNVQHYRDLLARLDRPKTLF
jgi:hypothetical protein